MVALVLKTRRKRWQRRHLHHPAATAQLEHTPGLQPREGAPGVCRRLLRNIAEEQGFRGAPAGTVGDLKANVRIKFTRHAVDHVFQAERGRHPTDQPAAPIIHRPRFGTRAVQRQVNRKTRAAVLQQRQLAGQREFSGVACPVQRFLGRRKGQHIKPQRLEVVPLQGLDVGDGRQHLPRTVGPNGVLGKPALAHVLQVCRQLRSGQLQNERHPLQARARFAQLERPHIGLKLGPVPFDAAKHHFVGGHPVLEVVGNLVGCGLKVLFPLGVGSALCALPVQERQPQGQQTHQRRHHDGSPPLAGSPRPSSLGGRQGRCPSGCIDGFSRRMLAHGVLGDGSAAGGKRHRPGDLRHYGHLSGTGKQYLRAHLPDRGNAGRALLDMLAGHPPQHSAGSPSAAL
jgi:hypothetical protein